MERSYDDESGGNPRPTKQARNDFAADAPGRKRKGNGSLSIQRMSPTAEARDERHYGKGIRFDRLPEEEGLDLRYLPESLNPNPDPNLELKRKLEGLDKEIAELDREKSRIQGTLELRDQIDKIDRALLEEIVLRAARVHEDVAADVNRVVESMREEESKRVLNFDQLSKRAWWAINTKSGYETYDMRGSFYVFESIRQIFNEITGFCPSWANPMTRYNALSVLRKIGKTICLSGGHELGKEMQEIFSQDSSLEDAMTAIVEYMTEEEKTAIREDESSPEALWPKLLELEGLAKQYDVIKGLGKVLDLIHDGPQNHESNNAV